MGLFESIKWVIENYPAISAIAGIGTPAAIYLGRRYRVIKLILRMFKDDRPSACLILGQGSTGKTTLINRMFADSTAMPEQETMQFGIHRLQIEVDGFEYQILASDYRGQKLDNLTRGILKLEKERQFSRASFSSLLIIMDIGRTLNGQRVTGESYPDYNRFREQLSQWSGQATEAILGLIEADRLRYALIFVNKIDLLSDLDEQQHRPTLKAECEELQQKIRHILPIAKVEVRLGSAQNADAMLIRDTLLKIAKSSKETH